MVSQESIKFFLYGSAAILGMDLLTTSPAWQAFKQHTVVATLLVIALIVFTPKLSKTVGK